MLTSTEITKLLTVPNEHNAMWLRAGYNRVLSECFSEDPFEVVWTVHPKASYSYFRVCADTDGYPFKPIFILFVMPKSRSRSLAGRREAEDMLKGLLKDADAPFAIIHGACVSASRIAFYSYDRENEVFTPESHLQGQFFDFDLTEDAGAVRMLEVVEEVKGMCRELLGKLKTEFRGDDSSWMSRLMSLFA
jgi:hypothetical protein